MTTGTFSHAKPIACKSVPVVTSSVFELVRSYPVRRVFHAEASYDLIFVERHVVLAMIKKYNYCDYKVKENKKNTVEVFYIECYKLKMNIKICYIQLKIEYKILAIL